MKRILVAAVCAALGCACLFGFYGCGTDPEYDVYVKYYCYYTDEYDYEPSPDKYVCTFKVDGEGATGELKRRESGYYFLTYEVFYSTGVPYDLNSEEKTIKNSSYVPADVLASETSVRYSYPLDLRVGEPHSQNVRFNLDIKIVP